MFSERLKFYKIIFETQFCRLTRFMRKLRYDLYASFWNDFRDVITACMVDYMDQDFDLYTVATGLSWGTDGLRHNYCVRIDYCTLPEIGQGSGFINYAPYRILEGRENMISAPYQRLEGSIFMDSAHYWT